MQLSRRRQKPLLLRGTRGTRARRWRTFLFSAGILLAVASFFTLFRAPLFRIGEIELRGRNSLQQETAEALLADAFGENIFLLPLEEKEERLRHDLPHLRKIELARRPPGKLLLIAEEWPAAWVLQIKNADLNKKLILDSGGFVAGLATPENAAGLPLLELESDREFSAKKEILTREDLQRLESFKKNLENQLDLRTKKVLILENAREAHFHLENSWEIWLIFDQNWEEALGNLRAMLRGQNLENLNLKYLDLRVPQRIFLKEANEN